MLLTTRSLDGVQVINWTRSIIKTIHTIHSMSIEADEIKKPKSHGPMETDFKVHLTPQYADNWCSAFGGGRTDSNDKHIHGLRVHLDKVLKDFRKSIYETSEIMAFEATYNDWIETPMFEHTSKVMNTQKLASEQ